MSEDIGRRDGHAAMSRGSHPPLAPNEAIAREPAPFPHTTVAEPIETGYADWRVRLTRNLARRSDGRWDPLTRIHSEESTTP